MMRFKYFIIFFLATILFSCNKAVEYNSSSNFNKGWQFAKVADTSVYEELFTKKKNNIKWEDVSLPHTANIEPLVTKEKQWQGTCFYRNFFTISKKAEGKHVAITIGAAMHEAHVYLNGKHILTHYGGYLPFYIDITDKIKFGTSNCILIKLNNEDNSLIPPGKPIKELDFNYYSGLYRNSGLIIKEKLHISDPIGETFGSFGGVMVWYGNVNEKDAVVFIKSKIQNNLAENSAYVLEYNISNMQDSMIANLKYGPVKISALSANVNSDSLVIEKPMLWSPSSPYLYKLDILLKSNGKVIDRESLKIGIRKFSVDKNGLNLNGKHLLLVGTNRHQEYPYIGNALSDNAQYRDAYKIKMAGFNLVRCSHYPQSPAFLDACDELGIIVMDAIPGWQFFGNDKFQNNSFQDIREMVRRDRNHPSVFFWEASLNESDMSHDFMEQAHRTVHEELPYPNVYTCGWKDEVYDIFIPARQHSTPPLYWKNYSNKPLLIAEYGDWEYYAQNAGFNQTEFKDLKPEERTSRQLREFGQERLAQQALNFQEAHNDNLGGKMIGDANWLMFDYNRGYAPDIESSGIMDIFRIPKQSFYFYKSQTNISYSGDSVFNKPIVYIANDWSGQSFNNIKIYSNCDEVILKLNNKIVGKQKPVRNKYSNNLPHPDLIFNLQTFEKGKLEAFGIINKKTVAYDFRLTPEKASGIKLLIDESGKKPSAGVNDIVFVYALIIDANGTIVPWASDKIRFKAEGDLKIIGPEEIDAKAGIATILVRIGEHAGKFNITASSKLLKNNQIGITTY